MNQTGYGKNENDKLSSNMHRSHYNNIDIHDVQNQDTNPTASFN